MATNGNHSWKFVRIGGVDQVIFRNGADVINIGQLDQKLWMALAMPTRGIEFDPKTADLVDTDKDGRIRPPEVIAAVKWLDSALKDPGEILKGGDSVALSSIKDPNLVTGAKRVLGSLNKPDAQVITLADVSDTVKILAETKFNGDGVVIADATEDAEVKKAIEEIIGCLGAVTDRSGKPGLNQAKLDQFFAEAKALSDWATQGEGDKSLTPIGFEDTTAASAAIKAVKPKVDDFFARCRLTAFDARALAAVNRSETEYLAIAAKDMSITAQEVAGFPLAKIEAGSALPLSGAVNPAWSGALSKLSSAAVGPLLGVTRASITEVDWAAIQAKVAAFDAWTGSKPATPAEKLGLARLRELSASGVKDKIVELIKQDAALEGEFSQMVGVEKLVRFQKDLAELLTNFVNFADFYGKSLAVFQAGTLYLDNRSCNLCVDVTEPGKHAALAGLAGCYLAYCDCARPGGLKRQIVSVFTDGASDNLIVGRNGVFYDRKGQDWDATISKIVSNPISIREAFWLPYKKLIRMIEEMAAKRAAAAEAASDKKMSGAATAVSTADKTAKPAEPKKVDVGTVAALGVAISGAVTALTLILGSVFGLKLWQYPLVVVGIMLVISGPSMIIAFLKLRKRNLGPILDANGWAINNCAKLNIPFGKSLTDMPVLPSGSERSLEDPYAEKKSPWPKLIVLAIILIVAWKLLDKRGLINEWTNGWIGTKVEKTTESSSTNGVVTVTNTVVIPAPEPVANPAPTS